MISIVVPVLNEEKNITRIINQLLRLEGDKEIIVVDGGSEDKTKSIAEKKVKVITLTPSGRALQMNAGARQASGEILWFVHVDSILSQHSLRYIKKGLTLGKKHGCFTMYFYDSKNLLIKLVSFFSSLRVRFWGHIFGDQGLFVKKDFFEQMGGFRNLDIMEDLDFCLKAKLRSKPLILKEKIGTSARRFQKGGILKTIFLMQKMKIFFFFGVSSQKLKRMYQLSK